MSVCSPESPVNRFILPIVPYFVSFCSKALLSSQATAGDTWYPLTGFCSVGVPGTNDY